MANGVIEFSPSGYLQGKVEWSSSSNGSSANSSNVSATIYARRTNNYTTTGQSWSGYVRIGSAQTNISFSSSVSVGPSWVAMASVSTTIGHNNDGTGSVNVGGSVTGPSGTSLSGNTSSGDQTVTLDKIPRASSVTCADGNIGSSTTININRASSGFTHTLRYAFGNLSGTIVTKTSNTNYGWNIPTSFYAQIPNAKNGTGGIYCDTYDGNTLIGTSSCTFKAFVVNSEPTITATIVDTNAITLALTGDEDKLIKYFSNAQVTMTATAQNSATISSKKVTCADGKTGTSTVSTLNGVESGTFNLTCIDSRGFAGTNTVTKTMVEYIRLGITNISVERLSSVSDTVNISISGNYFNQSFGNTNNSLTLKWKYREKNGTWSSYTTITPTITNNTFTYTGTLGTTFDYRKEYEFEIVAQDELMINTILKNVTAGIPLIDIWKDNFNVNGNIRENNYYMQKKGIILYDNPSGDTGDIVLDDSVANYSYIEIYFGLTTVTNGSYFFSEKIDEPNQKYVGVSFDRYVNDSAIQLIGAKIELDGTALNRIGTCFITFTNGAVSGYGALTSLYITKVIGYK